jgi:hypothetical protein
MNARISETMTLSVAMQARLNRRCRLAGMSMERRFTCWATVLGASRSASIAASNQWIIQGNESRLTPLWLQRAENVQQVLRVPGGALAAALDRSLVGDLADQVEGEVAYYRHVFGTVTGA